MTGRIERLESGGVTVRMSTREQELLRSLPDQLEPILRGRYDPAGVQARLFPPAYSDDEAEAEYRSLVGDDLAEERLGALHAFAETLDAGHVRGRSWQVSLDPDEAHAWLSALNDTRLILAAVAGVASEDAWEEVASRRDATAIVLWHVSTLQEDLLAALSGGLDAGSC